MSATVKDVILFSNGQIMVFDDNGDQIPEFQTKNLLDYLSPLVEHCDETTQFQYLEYSTGKTIDCDVGWWFKQPKQDFREKIIDLFVNNRGEIFQTGMESIFSRTLEEYIAKYGNEVVDILDRLIKENKANEELVAESLYVLGSIDHKPTYTKRFHLLVGLLEHPSFTIRDGATTGVDAMNTIESIPYLVKAIKTEKSDFIRNYMKEILEDLEETFSKKEGD